jgi:hypothetical protein
MIPLLPYQKIVIEVPYSREELTRRLGKEVTGRQWSWGWTEKRAELFEGVVSDEGFQISRIIAYRNSFLPVIQGRFHPHVKGVRVEITMRLHVAVLIFSVVWLSLVGQGALAAGAQILTTGRVDSVMLIPFGMLLFFYLMVTIGFGVEAKKASKLLNSLFEAEGSSAEKA